MLAGSQDVRKKLQDPLTDKESHEFFPVEVWIQICRYLYPSQLSQMSMVSKGLNAIVSRLNVWSEIFTIAYGPKAQLRLLDGIHKSKSYMLIICASSLHVCERCFTRADYELDSAFKLPLPTPMLLPKRPTKTVIYIGQRIDLTWTVRMCLACRKKHFLVYEEPYQLGLGQVWGSHFFKKYPAAHHTPQLSSLQGSYIKEKPAISLMRDALGGDVGIENVEVSTLASDRITEARIRWYQLQP